MTDYKLPADPLNGRFANIGGLISALIPYIYVFAGFALIFVILMGGYGVLTSGGVPEKTKMGYDKIAKGLTGFVIIIVSFLVVLLMEAILNIKIF